MVNKYENNGKILRKCSCSIVSSKPQAIQKVINTNPNCREAEEFAHNVVKLAESWEHDGLDENGCDWENNYPF